MIIAKADASQLTFMYIFIFVIIPLIHIGFAVVLSGMSARA